MSGRRSDNLAIISIMTKVPTAFICEAYEKYKNLATLPT